MGLASDEVVEIQMGKKAGEPSIVTVNCPDQTGLGCDLCRIILEFGLCITRGDVSTDGHWCFVVLWVVPCSPKFNIQWTSLKNRLLTACPSFCIPFYLDLSSLPKTAQMYLLKLFSVDRKGLLHDVTHVLSELELCIHTVKVSTTPDGRVMDLFFITDGMELLHTRKRQDETRQNLSYVLGDSCISCEIEEVECFQQGFSSLPPAVAEELFSAELSNSQVSSPTPRSDSAKMTKVNVTIDNSLSPCHTLLQIKCVDQKGLLYDILRTLKDYNIQAKSSRQNFENAAKMEAAYLNQWKEMMPFLIFRASGAIKNKKTTVCIQLFGTVVAVLNEISYGRFMSDTNGYHREIDLFIQQTDGKKIVDPEKQDALCSKLKLEMLHPLRVIVVSRGPDTELLVANSVELCGKGRPRVFYDVTSALKLLGICIFSAEIGKHSFSERQWEVYRFLLDERPEFPLSSRRARNQIVDGVRRSLLDCSN